MQDKGSTPMGRCSLPPTSGLVLGPVGKLSCGGLARSLQQVPGALPGPSYFCSRWPVGEVLDLEPRQLRPAGGPAFKVNAPGF